jgi:signal transduction histidine kinase
VGAVALAQRLVEQLVAVLGTLAGQATQPLQLATLPELVDWPRLLQLGDRAQQALEAADQSVDGLGHLVALLFDTAQARAGKLELRRQPTDLLALVRQQVEALRLVAPRRQIVLELPITPLPPVFVDADRIGQVLTNYLTNALKYSAEDRPVAVWVEVGGGRVLVSVRDQGPGLPPDEQVLVWQMFHRAHGVEVRSQVEGVLGLGLGLGLHICKLIIEGHGGQVGVESQVGQGSTFWFSLSLGTPTT